MIYSYIMLVRLYFEYSSPQDTLSLGGKIFIISHYIACLATITMDMACFIKAVRVMKTYIFKIKMCGASEKYSACFDVISIFAYLFFFIGKPLKDIVFPLE